MYLNIPLYKPNIMEFKIYYYDNFGELHSYCQYSFIYVKDMFFSR